VIFFNLFHIYLTISSEWNVKLFDIRNAEPALFLANPTAKEDSDEEEDLDTVEVEDGDEEEELDTEEVEDGRS